MDINPIVAFIIFVCGMFFGAYIMIEDIEESFTFISDKSYNVEQINKNTFKLIETDNVSLNKAEYKFITIKFESYK